MYISKLSIKVFLTCGSLQVYYVRHCILKILEIWTVGQVKWHLNASSQPTLGYLVVEILLIPGSLQLQVLQKFVLSGLLTTFPEVLWGPLVYIDQRSPTHGPRTSTGP